jgi:hypothetical protein
LFVVSPEEQFFLHSCDRFLLVQGKCFFEVLFDFEELQRAGGGGFGV